MSYSYPINVYVGSGGGTIDGDDGLRLVIPSGMFRGSSLITITQRGHIGCGVRGKHAASEAWEISSSLTPTAGTRFTLFLPFYVAFRTDKNTFTAMRVERGTGVISNEDPGIWVPMDENQTDPRTGDYIGGRAEVFGFFQCKRLYTP